MVHENNYPIHDLLLVVVVFVLMIWRHYLYGVHVDVLIGHRSLQYLFKQNNLNLRQRRWLVMDVKAKHDEDLVELKKQSLRILYRLSS
ncbi:hypothetical protein MTR67_030721 [Solanum verrucosum]|uniref:Reverse transcriptase RNase H-like domain-containing protein n=1 Tax=Solanum verrucosum TaxID=315347 RepID=A0AAF0ZCK2_SOLVR|nr:hypothetical protein MTR67_030721 [Solanum verrucosum]